MFVAADEDATLLFYFAGHGVTVDNGTFLVTLDSEDDIESGVHLTRLVEIVNSSRKPLQNCVFLLDCCHAGALAIENISVSLQAIQEALVFAQGVVLIAATESSEKAKENDELKQGVFTYWLFYGLAGYAANSEGKVTISSLYDFVAKAMSEYDHAQKPVLKTNIVGTGPILGQGFKPQNEVNPSRLTEARRQEIDSTIRSQLQVVRRNIEVDRETWRERIYKETCSTLSHLAEWMADLSRSHPELNKGPMFQQYDSEIIKFQNELVAPVPGTNLPEGKVVREVGTGGFGTVYIVDTLAGMRAYKLYHPTELRNKPKAKAFLRGYKAMRQLDHPNIVKVYNDTKAPLGFYMQYIDGVNFRQWWMGNTTRLIHVLQIVAQALEYAHSRGVIHRDVKPENILIRDDGQDIPNPLLTDFDLSWYSMATTFSTEGDAAIVALGHYLYAAPEQYENPEADIARKATTDVFSFGQLSYFAILGQDPPNDTGMSITALQSRLGDWLSAEAATKFVEMYSKCIRRKPSERYSSMAEVSSVLLDIRNILIDPDRSQNIEPDKFLAELIFSFYGFEIKPEKVFFSRSGQTQIDIQKMTRSGLEIKIEVAHGFVGQTGAYDKQRENISRRMDKEIAELRKEFKTDISRHSEQFTSVYGTVIYLPGNHLTLAGVAFCRRVILAVVKVIEL